MATKAKTPTDEKFENMDFDMFAAIAALDKKDYAWFDKLTTDQQKKFSPYMLTHWMSVVKGGGDLQSYYLQSLNLQANKHLLDEAMSRHAKLQWLLLCAVSPGLGKQYHQWIPHIKLKVSLLKEAATVKETRDYYKKIYPKADEQSVDEISKEFVKDQRRKMYFAEVYPNLKHQDIEILNGIVTDEEIKQYEKDRGN